jgi:outer membrane protein OmpA-like peptidoglycan-associated protein
MKKTFLLWCAFLLPILASAQEKWEAGLFAGYSNYMGDLVVPAFTFEEANPSIGLMVKHNLSENLGLRFNLMHGKISGTDRNYDRNLGRDASFESSLVEVSLISEYELFGHKRYGSNGSFKKIITPYFFGGLGASFGSPKVKNGESIDYSDTYFSVPAGVGLRLDASRKVSFALEIGGRYTFNDALDGISEQKGNPNQNDVYYMGGLVLNFRLGNRDADNDGVTDDEDRCPALSGPPFLNGCPDSDGDGIADRDDGCINEAGEVRLNGCPDADGDGVADNKDDCPNDAGLRRFSGCPDTDGDDVIDKEDNCPTVAGLAAMNGCPDSDRDGITDASDECPNEPGTGEHLGCPDTDNDGIRDSEDECPAEPGLARFKGCGDTDNDGIPNNRDKCKFLAGINTVDGCPEIKPEDKAVLEKAMQSIQFQSGSSKLLPVSFDMLNQIAEIFSRYPGFMLKIDGYTDNVGNDFVNQQVSEARALACYEYLLGKGINKDFMSYKGHGESNPIADNNTALGRRINRRVSFTLVPKE